MSAQSKISMPFSVFTQKTIDIAVMLQQNLENA
jgi:hypothetical protein